MERTRVDNRQRRPEYVPPMKQVDGEPSDDGTNRDRHKNTHGVYCHRIATPLRRQNLERRNHHQRLDDARRHALHDAADDDHVEVLTQRADQAADDEHQRHQQKPATLPERGDHPDAQKLTGHHRDIECRRHQLRLIKADPERPHDSRYGDGDDGSGDNHRERRRHASDHHENPVGFAIKRKQVVNRFSLRSYGESPAKLKQRSTF